MPRTGTPPVEHVGRELRRALLEDAGGAAGEDEALDVQVRQLLLRDIVGVDLAVDMGLTYAAGDEAAELGAEVEDDDRLVTTLGGFAGSSGLPEILLGDFQVGGDLYVACGGDPVALWPWARAHTTPFAEIVAVREASVASPAASVYALPHYFPR